MKVFIWAEYFGYGHDCIVAMAETIEDAIAQIEAHPRYGIDFRSLKGFTSKPEVITFEPETGTGDKIHTCNYYE